MPFSLNYFKTRQRTAPDWVIPNLLKRKNTLILMGEPKRACKSWLLLNMGWQLSNHLPVWDIRHTKDGPLFKPFQPLRVVYFAQEDAEDDIHDRVDLLLKAGAKPNDRMWFVPKNLANVFDNPNGMSSIMRELAAIEKDSGPIDLVLFDPMRRMHNKSENDSENIAVIWQRLHEIHERFNCATVLTHHLNKPPKDKKNSSFDPSSPHAARGSGDIFGGGDAFINVVEYKMKGQTQGVRYLTLYFETKRAKALYPAKIELNFETGFVQFIGLNFGRPPKEELKPQPSSFISTDAYDPESD